MLRLGDFWSPLQVRGSTFTFSWLPSPFGLPSPPSLPSSSVPRPCLLSSPPDVRAEPRSCQMVPKGPHYLACVPVAEQPCSLLISMPGLLFQRKQAERRCMSRFWCWKEPRCHEGPPVLSSQAFGHALTPPVQKCPVPVSPASHHGFSSSDVTA